MANRLSNDYYGFIIAEGTYGSQQKTVTGAQILPCSIEIKKNVMVVDTTQKTNTLEPSICEKTTAGSSATVTIKGDMCKEYGVLFQAQIHDSSSPYTFPTDQPAGFSYTIYKYWSKGTARYDCGIGCKAKTFNITGEANGLVQFEATFEAVSMRRAVANTGGDTISTVPSLACVTPFKFGEVTATIFNTATKLNSFALNLENVYADDRVLYQNSLTKINQTLTGQTGTLALQTIYDDAQDPTHEGNIGVGTSVATTIVLVSGANSFTIATYSRIADFASPDQDKGLCIADYSLELARDGSNVALTVTAA